MFETSDDLENSGNVDLVLFELDGEPTLEERIDTAWSDLANHVFHEIGGSYLQETGESMEGLLVQYMDSFLTVEDVDPKDPKLQKLADVIMKKLLGTERGRPAEYEEWRRTKALDFFNIHRILTKFHGYDANGGPSSDVTKFFQQDIPEEGLIYVDFFAVQNFVSNDSRKGFIEECIDRGIDLSRLRIRVPRGAFFAQLATMSFEKRADFIEVCKGLRADQFILSDANTVNVHDIGFDEDEAVAALFSPRTLPIQPERYEDPVGFHREVVRGLTEKAVQGAVAFLNVALEPSRESDDGGEPYVDSRVVPGKSRTLAKIDGNITEPVFRNLDRLLEANGWHLGASLVIANPDSTDHRKKVADEYVWIFDANDLGQAY